MDSKFKIGDVVRLRSGSVAMTIGDIDEDDEDACLVKCMYWNGENFSFDDIEVPPDLLTLSVPDNYIKGA